MCFCFQFSPSSAAAVTQRQALPGTHPCSQTRLAPQVSHHRQQKHLRSFMPGFPLQAVSQETAMGFLCFHGSFPSYPVRKSPNYNGVRFQTENKSWLFWNQTRSGSITHFMLLKVIWLNMYLNYFGTVLNAKAFKCVQWICHFYQQRFQFWHATNM